MIKNEEGFPAGFVYVDVTGRDMGRYVEEAKQVVAKNVQLPAGYHLIWSGQYEYLQRVVERLWVVVPITLFVVFLLLFFNTGSFVKTVIILLAVPFSAIGAIWFLYLLNYNMSIAVWVGLIALLGVDAETAVFMLLYLDLAYDDRKAKGQMRSIADLKAAIEDGAVKRLRPKVMTVAVMFMGLVPIMWSTGAGSDVMRRIAAPMIGGIFTSFILELVVYPAIYEIWKTREVRRLAATEPCRSVGDLYVCIITNSSAWLLAVSRLQADFQYDVVRSRPLQKDEPGQLRIDGSGIEYRSANGKTSVRLPFIDVRELDLSDPAAIRIETYEMLKRKLAGRRTYEFRLRSSRNVQDNDRLVQFVSDRVRRPVLANYSTVAKVEFEIPAYHRHVLSGCNGTLQITPEGIRFLSTKEGHSRTWRYSEIQTIGGSDPFSFRVTTLTETFVFDLKDRLPKEAYELVWQRVYDLQPKYDAARPVAIQERKP